MIYIGIGIDELKLKLYVLYISVSADALSALLS